MDINILHISTSTGFRGGEQQVVYLINSLDEYKVNQTIICPKNAPLIKKINKNCCNFIEFKKRNFIDFSFLNLINQTCRSNNIQIIHAHDSKAHTFAVLSTFTYKLLSKVIVTRRVIFPVAGFLSKLKYKTNIVKSIICESKAVQSEMIKIVPKEKTQIINSGIDINKFKKVKYKKYSFLKNNTIKIAYVAALTFEKDHSTFLKTAKQILRQNKNVSFYIVGDGKLKNEIIKTIKKNELEDYVVMTGFIDDISSLIPKFDYLLFTSKYEGLGTTILDFYLAKIPVITTNCGGNNEISLHKKTAMVSEVGDYRVLSENFFSLLNNEVLKEKIIFNSYNLVVNDFSLNELGSKTIKEYIKVLD